MILNKIKIVFRLFLFILSIIAGSIFVFPNTSYAVDQAQAENITVGAFIDSPVSEKNSTVYANNQEVLANPLENLIVLSVTLHDTSGNILANKEVRVTSNRGDIDMIESTDKLSSNYGQKDSQAYMQVVNSDDTGNATFRVTSFVPGDVYLNVVADGIVNLKTIKVKFDPVSSPYYLTISTGIPFTDKNWTIISPKIDENKLSPLQKINKSVNNLGTRLTFPFWLFILLIFILIGSPTLVILGFINIRKMRKFAKQDSELIQKIAEAENIKEVRENLRGGSES